MNVVKFAREVIDMHERIQWLEHEVARLSEYEQKYSDMLGDNLQYQQHVMGQLFTLGLRMAEEKDRAATP